MNPDKRALTDWCVLHLANFVIRFGLIRFLILTTSQITLVWLSGDDSGF